MLRSFVQENMGIPRGSNSEEYPIKLLFDKLCPYITTPHKTLSAQRAFFTAVLQDLKCNFTAGKLDISLNEVVTI